MAYDNTNTGILGKNKRKESDKHPDITGSINVEGKDYWLNGWQKTNANGTFYSLSVKPKAPPADFSDLGGSAGDDSIPFAPEWR